MDTPNQNPIEPVQAQDSTRGDSEIAQHENQPPRNPPTESEPPPTVPDNDSSKNRRRKISDLRKAAVFWLEIGTFIALIAYATISRNQWQEMIAATSAAQQAVIEARFNRIQADKVFKATVEQFQLDQRAWIGPEQIANELSTDKKTVTWIGFILKNSGKTPALNVEYHCAINTIPVTYRVLPPTSSYTFHYLGESKKSPIGSRGVIQPNMTVTIGPQNIPTAEEISAVRNGTKLEYMYGMVTYDDIFKQRRRTAKFCVYFDPDLWGTHSCPVYNDTD